MAGRGVWGGLVILWMTFSVGVLAQTGLLYLNEEPVSLPNPVIQQGAAILVPFVEFASRLGLDVTESDERFMVRGAGFRQFVGRESLLVKEGVAYIGLDQVVELVGGVVHRLGGNVYVETPRSEFLDVDATSTQITVRLSQYTSYASISTEQPLSDVVLITWPNCTLGIDAQLIRVGESGIQEVRLVGTRTAVELSIRLEPGTTLATEEQEADDAYAVTFRVAETGFHQSVIELDSDVTVHEWTSADASRAVDFLHVEFWRDRFRLTPMIPTSGDSSADTLESILEAHDAIAAVSVEYAGEDSEPDCLIIDAIPYRIPETPARILAVDLFGRWTSFSSQCAVSLKHNGRMISVDGVDRPLSYGEIVAYAPGYQGTIARGIPGTFTAIKIRSKRVVSVYQGPFVPQDATAIVVVASGEAKALLSLVQLGDPMDIVCTFLNKEGTYLHAVSSGPMLVQDGARSLSDEEFDALSALSGGTVLACDWQGGLYLLTFQSLPSEQHEEGWNVLDALAKVPTVIKDAILLSPHAERSLAYKTASGTFLLGDDLLSGLAFGLVPIAP
jgi:hypothetical protein